MIVAAHSTWLHSIRAFFHPSQLSFLITAFTVESSDVNPVKRAFRQFVSCNMASKVLVLILVPEIPILFEQIVQVSDICGRSRIFPNVELATLGLPST
jgi:hypothetical protein